VLEIDLAKVALVVRARLAQLRSSHDLSMSATEDEFAPPEAASREHTQALRPSAPDLDVPNHRQRVGASDCQLGCTDT